MRQPPPWHTHWIRAARLCADRSKDPNTQVGCVLVRDNQQISSGYNGFVSKFPERPELWERPTKYTHVIHAEENALLSAAKRGVSVADTTAYLTHAPCVPCLRHMLQAGIRNIVVDTHSPEAKMVSAEDREVRKNYILFLQQHGGSYTYHDCA